MAPSPARTESTVSSSDSKIQNYWLYELVKKVGGVRDAVEKRPRVPFA